MATDRALSSQSAMDLDTAAAFLYRACSAEARVRQLEATMLRCAEKLEMWGNDEPQAVARALRQDASQLPRPETPSPMVSQS